MSFERSLQQSLIWRGTYFITVLLLNIVLSRYLGVNAVGIVFYLVNFFSLVILIGGISMESSFTYYAAGNIIEPGKLATFGILWSILICGFVFAILPVYYDHFEKDILISKEEYTRDGILFSGGLLLINFSTALFYAKRNFFVPNLVLALMNICMIVIIMSGQLPVRTGIHFYFLFTLFTGMLLMIIFFIKNKKTTIFVLPESVELVKLFRYSLVAFLANVVFFLVYRIDYWFVRYNCSLYDLGNYIQASKLAQMLLILPQLIAAVIFPHTAANHLNENVIVIMGRVARLFFQLFIIIFVVILFAGRWLFPFVFGKGFDHIQLPLLLLLPGIFSLSLLCMLSAYFAGKGKMKINLVGASLGLATVVIGNTIFITGYNVYVAAIVSTVGYTVSLLYSLTCFYREERSINKKIRFWQKDDWPWLINLIFNK